MVVPSLAALAFVGEASARAEAWRVDEDASLLAVVTHKAGIGARLAHNHLVVARDYTTTLAFDSAAPEASGFEVLVPVGELVVDDPELQGAHYPRLVALGILEEPFSPLKEKNRQKIRAAMLGEKQLDAGRFPTLEAKVVAVAAKESRQGEEAFTHEVTLELRLRDATARAPMAARYTRSGDGLRVEAVGSFRFTELGIEPYSAALGAVRNEDLFHLVLDLRAQVGQP